MKTSFMQQQRFLNTMDLDYETRLVLVLHLCRRDYRRIAKEIGSTVPKVRTILKNIANEMGLKKICEIQRAYCQFIRDEQTKVDDAS